MRCPCRTSYTRFESGQQQSCRLWSRKLQVLGPQGPLLTNRMSELFTYGSVGGGGSNPAPYPAVDAEWRFLFAFQCPWPRATQGER